jgi:hypothetical protein
MAKCDQNDQNDQNSELNVEAQKYKVQDSACGIGDFVAFCVKNFGQLLYLFRSQHDDVPGSGCLICPVMQSGKNMEKSTDWSKPSPKR